MSEPLQQSAMPEEGRALLTEREREILSGEADVSDNYRYKVQSTVRNRIRKHLADDFELLATDFYEAWRLAADSFDVYQCPACGKLFRSPDEAVNHAIASQDDLHPVPSEELPTYLRRAMDWDGQDGEDS